MGCNKVPAASHSKINIVEGRKQESVYFQFRLLKNERNNHNLWEDRVDEGVEGGHCLLAKDGYKYQ